MVSIKLASSKRSLSTASLLDSSMVIFHSQHLANPISNLSSLSNHNSNSLFMLECHSSSQTCRYADLFVLGEWDVRERIFLLPMLGHFFHQCAFFCQQAQSGKFTGYVPQQTPSQTSPSPTPGANPYSRGPGYGGGYPRPTANYQQGYQWSECSGQECLRQKCCYQQFMADTKDLYLREGGKMKMLVWCELCDLRERCYDS